MRFTRVAAIIGIALIAVPGLALAQGTKESALTTVTPGTGDTSTGLQGGVDVNFTNDSIGDRSQITGDCAKSRGSTGCTIPANTVTNAKAAQMPASTIKGNNTGGTANATDLTVTQVTAMLAACLGDSGAGGTKGLVPAPGSGDAAAGKFLKADCTFAVPAGAGVSVTAATPNIVVTPSPGTTSFTIGTTENIRANSGTSDTILAGDNTKLVTHSNAAAVAVTLPQAGTTGFGAGFSYCDQNRGAGVVTLTTTTSTILGGGQTLTLLKGAGACLASDGTDWIGVVGKDISSSDSLTAHAGGGKASALLLTSAVNRISIVGTAADSVLLPPSYAGATLVVTNGAAANAMQVFGNGTDTINDVATATGVSQAAGITTLYQSPVAGKWYATLLAVPSAAPGGSNGQIQYNNSGALGGFTLGGDCTFAQPNITCTSLNGIALGTSGTKIPQLNTANTWAGTQTFATIGGYLATVTTDISTARTLSSADCGTFVKFTSASAITVTLPNSLSVGCQVAMEQNGAGQITLSAASGATLHSAHSYTKSFAQFAVVGVTVDTNAGGTAAIYAMTGDGA